MSEIFDFFGISISHCKFMQLTIFLQISLCMVLADLYQPDFAKKNDTHVRYTYTIIQV